jgi:enamine deaminase RidA (YjgF/YER057c/UK114 family)
MGYSRAVVKGGWCFVSGVTGYDYATMTIPENVAEQTVNAFKTIDGVLEKAGFEMADVVRVQYTIVTAECLDLVQPEVERVFGKIRPAATMIVAGLIRPEMQIEIEVTAFKG